MSTVKIFAKDISGEGRLSSIGSAAMVEGDFIVDLSVVAPARFFNEHGWPQPSEIASSASGVEEGPFRPEPERLLFGAQMFICSLLYSFGVLLFLGIHFFLYVVHLLLPSFI